MSIRGHLLGIFLMLATAAAVVFVGVWGIPWLLDAPPADLEWWKGLLTGLCAAFVIYESRRLW